MMGTIAGSGGAGKAPYCFVSVPKWMFGGVQSSMAVRSGIGTPCIIRFLMMLRSAMPAKSMLCVARILPELQKTLICALTTSSPN